MSKRSFVSRRHKCRGDPRSRTGLQCGQVVVREGAQRPGIEVYIYISIDIFHSLFPPTISIDRFLPRLLSLASIDMFLPSLLPKKCVDHCCVYFIEEADIVAT